MDPSRYNKTRRKIDKIVREDRRKRHNNKREEDELAAAFGQQTIAATADEHANQLPPPALEPAAQMAMTVQ